MKKFFCTLLTVSAIFCSLAAPRSNPIVKIYDPALKVVHFLPGGLHGIYDKGEKVSFSLVLAPKATGTAEMEIEVLDINKKKIETIKVSRPVTAGKNTALSIPVKDPGKYGHFTLDAKVRLNGKICLFTQSAFAVIPPPPKNMDRHFILDGRNPHYGFNLVPAIKRVGVDTVGLTTMPYHLKDPALGFKAYFKNPGKYPFGQVIGYLQLGEYKGEKEPPALRKAGFFPYSPEYYKRVDDIVRTCAQLGKGTIKHWCLLQEVDGHMTKLPPVSVMADHIIRVQRISRVLREVDPECKISVMNSCGDDFFSNDFRHIRMLLKETARYVDYYALDSYSGTWNGLLSDLEPPEKDDKFKAILLASSKMAVEFLLPPQIIQAERGYFIPYMDALNAPKSMDLMNFNARSIIIARGIKEVISYSRHAACSWYLPYQVVHGKANPEKLVDGGLWRSVYDSKKQFALVPRPSAPAFATVIRMLSHVTDPEEVRIAKGIYSYTFKRPDGKRLAAVWSVGENTRATFDLPCEAVHHDLMGNASKLKKGKQTLTLTQSPCFLELPAEKTAVRNMLKKAFFPDIKTFNGIVKNVSPNAYDLYVVSYSNRPLKIRLAPGKGLKAPAEISLKSGETQKIRLTGKPSAITLDDGSRRMELKVPDQPAISVPFGTKPKILAQLKYPDHIRPIAALRAERNLFRGDGTDISADFAASWDQNFLYLQFAVRDKTHLQRQTGSSIWRDDCIQFAIDAGNNALPVGMAPRSGFDKDDYVFGLALSKNGPLSYAWYNGKKRAEACSFKTEIVRKDGQTLYKTAIPWSAISGIKPVRGTVFGFTFLVMDNNDPSFRSAPYRLEWTGGIAGKQNPYLFKALILQ